MGVYSPNIFNNSTSFLEVSSSNVDYEEIKQSFASNAYLIHKIYIASPLNINQIIETYLYQHFDSNGNQIYDNIIFPIDPYQRQASTFEDMNGTPVIFDGRSSLAFSVLPLVAFKMTFFYKRVNTSSFLNRYHKSNFVSVEDGTNDPDFFDGYADIIPDV